MFKKLILLSSILTILSIAPARAQYSFSKIYGGSGDDRPYGMTQLSNGNFIFYGYYTDNTPGDNYIGCIDKFGNLLWEKKSTDPYGKVSEDCFESDSGDIFITGESAVHDGSAHITRLKADGTIVFDTTLRLNTQAGESGFIFRSLHSDAKNEIVSIGFAGKFQVGYILFHKANYNGQQLMYKFIKFPDNYFQMKNFFKVKGKEEYLVFGKRLVIRLDSVGNQIDSVRTAVDGSVDEDRKILDIVQNEDGTFTSLTEIRPGSMFGYHLRHHNDSGFFDKYLGFIAKSDTAVDVYYRALTKTKDKGYFVAGSHFALIDSMGNLLWNKFTGKTGFDMEMISTGQALDGGFYGCALEYEDSDNTSYNMYVFKTTPEGDINTGLIPINKQRLKAQVMPNPSQGIFTITGEFKQAQVSVSNLLGQEVLHSKTVMQGDKLDASGLEAGIYILTVTDQHNSHVQKVNIIK